MASSSCWEEPGREQAERGKATEAVRPKHAWHTNQRELYLAISLLCYEVGE